MSVFIVDPDKCDRDGLCVLECPAQIIEMDKNDPVPRPSEMAGDLCMDCGHCVAVCPKGAFFHRSMSPDECPPLQKELLLGPEQAAHFLRSRRSIRVWKDKKVEKDLIEKLIKTARFAPSGHNLQPVMWHVIHDRKDVEKMAGHVADWMRYMMTEHKDVAEMMHMDLVVEKWEKGSDGICRGAPHVIVAHGPAQDPTAQTAATIALTYLDLAAHALGLGSCWAGFFNAAAAFFPPMQKALGLPEGNACLGAMMLGYPRLKYHRLPNRKEPVITWA
ncbi:Ferridoxin [Candidatus Desulfarcum epimagneticum]|uniref:Ferridoxin n=1 Tax=uncultured Desulfobacteraceae bacterium TaxID=218296 RepID=A0A484HH42_9BACT|nr:Ferridoxin [uncultured Desulfobacteraceae bacterium]